MFVADVSEQKLPFTKPGNDIVRVAAVREFRHSESFQCPFAVAIGDQAANQLDSRVTECLVVEIDRVLGSHPGADAVCTALFEEGQQRTFGRRVLWVRWNNSLYLVHVEESTEAR